MAWFPLEVDTSAPTWRFDIVGLLAVVGGSSIEKYAYAITGSHIGALPRLLPAPETMLNIKRSAQLPSTPDVKIISLASGWKVDELAFFGDIIHDVDSLTPFQFQHFKIYHRKPNISDAIDLKSSMEGITTKIYLHPLNPLNLVTIGSVLLTIVLFVLAGVEHDAVALLGLGTMCLSTSTACLSSLWSPRIIDRRTTDVEESLGGVLIKTRSMAFVYVECTEGVARELYYTRPYRDYVFQGFAHKALLTISTVSLMASIIFFSNCTWKIQIAVGLAYIVLNLAYFTMALGDVASRTIWNMSERYTVEHHDDYLNQNLTDVMWNAIRATRETDWVRETGSLPATPNWDGWLDEARKNCDNEEWDAHAARARWMVKKLGPRL